MEKPPKKYKLNPRAARPSTVNKPSFVSGFIISFYLK